MTIDNYVRAERFLPWNKGRLVYNNEIAHRWVRGSDLLWYKKETEQGWQFMLAQPVVGRKYPAFDHDRMALLLGRALGTDLAADKLPITNLEFVDEQQGLLRVTIQGERLECDLDTLSYVSVGRACAAPDRAYSADGSYAVFVRGPNLWMENRRTGEERALTFNGQERCAYGARPEQNNRAITDRRQGGVKPPVGIFSPDGTKFLTHCLDDSAVPRMPLLQHVPEDGSLRPKLWSFRYALPGDEPATARLFVFDLASGKGVRIEHPAMVVQLHGPIDLGQVIWSADSAAIYILDYRDSYRELHFSRADAASGETGSLLVERSDTNVVLGPPGLSMPSLAVLANGDFIWPSERSGWRHLYMYDAAGRLKNAITSGTWAVRELLRVDEVAGTLIFSAGSSDSTDPYFRQIHEVRLDGTDLRKLTTESADHHVASARAWEWRETDGLSCSGNFFVDSYSRPDQPTVTVIRDRQGRIAIQLETAHLDTHMASQYLHPEPFNAMAADGSTVLHGCLFKPSTFDPHRSYPVVDSIYPGPQTTRVSKRFLGDAYYAQAVAELGFIVVAVDGRGTPFRSKSFRDASYGCLGTAGFLEDHIAAIRELACSRPYMDLDRVGIYGMSAGGFAAVHAVFDHPDFYKVAVAVAGSHDLRLTARDWGGKYQGPYDPTDYGQQSSYLNARDFKGKLLLATGDLDDNTHPANTLRVVNALIEHNKTFDFLMLPNRNHEVFWDPYLIRRTWDFLVTHLQSVCPPRDYAFQGL